ncbi:MAG: cobyrinate a,c-diamide synthase [Pseudomonadota bacterium]
MQNSTAIPCLERFARIIVAGLNGGTGKTILSLGLVRALSMGMYTQSPDAAHGHTMAIKPFKKGPDYIDAEWLGLAAGRSATNLDPYFLTPDRIRTLFCHAMLTSMPRDLSCSEHDPKSCSPKGLNMGADMGIIEGNRGLFDGRDVTGTCSTAELARILKAPVILAMDCTKMTRTAAAIVAGMANFEKDVHIAGVVLNRTANDRHRSMLRQCIEHYTDVPVLGALPRLKVNPIPERHMGLVSDREFAECRDELDAVARFISDNVDVQRVIKIAESTVQGDIAQTTVQGDIAEVQDAAVESLWSNEIFGAVPSELSKISGDHAPIIGYVRDAALWFYYEENFEALRHAGATLVELSLLDDAPWPKLDGLYLGGGFPEVLAAELETKRERLDAIRQLAHDGMPIYAECGGFMVLGDAIEMKGQVHHMAGVFPTRTVFHPKPQGLGYVDAEVTAPNAFFPVGTILRGHEFHYSQVQAQENQSLEHALRLPKGTGMGKVSASTGSIGQDGLVFKNTFAAYTHLFAPAVPQWAPAFVKAAQKYAKQ